MRVHAQNLPRHGTPLRGEGVTGPARILAKQAIWPVIYSRSSTQRELRRVGGKDLLLE